MIHTRKSKIMSYECEEDSHDKNETNTFSQQFNISSISEDPFADDFKEDKIITQM